MKLSIYWRMKRFSENQPKKEKKLSPTFGLDVLAHLKVIMTDTHKKSQIYMYRLHTVGVNWCI